MLTKRIIPCLDVKNGKVVKGINFKGLRDVGEPPAMAAAYEKQGADEITFLDITASSDARRIMLDTVRAVARAVYIPFTVGGGINELADVERLLNAGADKVSVNSAALRNPGLINEITGHFGSQVCVVAIDAKETEEGWFCYLNGGRIRTERGLFEWAREVCDRGAGEILFTSMDHDGVKNGYANQALSRLAEELSIPVIASGGAGSKEHFRDTFIEGKSDAAWHHSRSRCRSPECYLRSSPGMPHCLPSRHNAASAPHMPAYPPAMYAPPSANHLEQF